MVKVVQALTVIVVCLALYISTVMFSAAMGNPYSGLGIPYVIKIEAGLTILLIAIWMAYVVKNKLKS